MTYELVKNLIGFSCEEIPFDSLSITVKELFNKFIIFCVFIFIRCSQNFGKIQN